LLVRVVALCAALIFGVLPVALVAAATADRAGEAGGTAARSAFEMGVLAGRSAEPELTDMPPLPSRAPTPEPTPAPTVLAAPAAPPAAAPPPPPPAPVVAGTASNYPGTAGYIGQATVALPGAMGGAYTGAVQGYVTVCAERCARLPVVDWCQCYWGSADQRVADISHAAWPLITDLPLSRGLVQVRVILDDPGLARVWEGG
jgi:hypothetical protein